MRKLFITLIAVMALITLSVAPALTCDGPDCTEYFNYSDSGSVGVNPMAEGSGYENSAAFNVNDEARAGAQSNACAENEGRAEWNFDNTSGTAFGHAHVTGDSDASTYAKDYGTSSYTGGFANSDAQAHAYGDAEHGSWYDGWSENFSGAEVQGSAQTMGNAREINYGSGTGVVATGFTAARFSGGETDYDYDQWYDIDTNSGVRLAGAADSYTKSEAHVDPFGVYQSAYGETYTGGSANVWSNDWERNGIQGNGFVGADAYGRGTYAGGTADFNFSGDNRYSIDGAGNAWVDAVANGLGGSDTFESHTSAGASAYVD